MEMRSRTAAGTGFTLIELLVVIVIILSVSAVALPTVLLALSHRQVSESARILQGVLAGARDSAIRTNAPSGIRLLPDPVLNGIDPSTGLLNPSLILASNRFIPIEPAPPYSEGLVSIGPVPVGFYVPYPGPGGGWYPVVVSGSGVLLLEEGAFVPFGGSFLPNPPTSWFWNIRVGDRLQINNAGPWYTVVGPMNVTSAQGNSELFVNVGPPGTRSPLARAIFNPTSGQAIVYYPDFLFLVNGRDDNGNGWTDEGWDGVDNNGDGNIDELAEWETEQWLGACATQVIINVPYVIQRRPAPGPNAREVALPSQVVIDLTTWGTTRERSRLPVNSYTGYVDIVVNPDGSVVPTTVYSSPASFGLSSAFLHFWLAERGDLAGPNPAATAAPFLPIQQAIAPARQGGLPLKGEYRLVTIFSRTGHMSTNENVPFDNPAAPATGKSYNPNLPFLAAQQGVSAAH